MNLFPEEIPVLPITRDIENQLKALKDKLSQFDVYYTVSGALEERRSALESLWSKYEQYTDKNFIPQARVRFHQKSWEMYLGNVLLEHGFKLEKIKSNNPDLKVVDDLKPTTWIECVAPERGTTEDGVPEMAYGVVQDVPRDRILLRIANSFDDKSKAFLKYIEDRVVKDNEPRVIAINVAALGYVDGDPPWIINMLFAVGHLTLVFDKEHTHVISQHYSKIDRTIKLSGSEVLFGQFLDDKYKHISGVIYSRDNIINMSKVIGTECVFIPNPFAEVPIPENTFPFMGRFVSEGDKIHRIEGLN